MSDQRSFLFYCYCKLLEEEFFGAIMIRRNATLGATCGLLSTEQWINMNLFVVWRCWVLTFLLQWLFYCSNCRRSDVDSSSLLMVRGLMVAVPPLQHNDRVNWKMNTETRIKSSKTSKMIGMDEIAIKLNELREKE